MVNSRRGEKFVIAAAAFAALSCGRRGSGPDEIVLLNEIPIARVDPRFASTSWDLRVSHLIAPGLVGLADEGLGSTPGLAETMTWRDPLVLEARLRSEARFPDGRVVDAEDVRYTFNSLVDPALGSPHRQVLSDMVAAVDVIDSRTVRFRLRRPHASLKTELAIGILDRFLAEPIDRALRAARGVGGSGLPPKIDLLREAVGAGPYRIVERSADRIVLERNPHAFVRARTARLIVRAIRDDNARVLALMGGSGDLILNGVTPLVLDTIARRPDLRIAYAPSATVTYIGFNLDDRFLGDVRVRRAIAQAIDRDQLIKARFSGRARRANSFLDQGNHYFSASARIPDFDPAGARRLLAAAVGPVRGGGNPAPIAKIIWKTSNVRFRVGLVQAMARQLADIGIEVDVRAFDFATLLTDVRHGNYQMFSLQMTDVVDPDILRLVFHSRQIPTPDTDFGGLNRFRFRDRQVDEWLDRAAAEIEPDVRRDLYRRAQDAIADRLPMLPLWHEDNVMVYRRGIEGAELLKTGRLEGLLGAWKPAAATR